MPQTRRPHWFRQSGPRLGTFVLALFALGIPLGAGVAEGQLVTVRTQMVKIFQNPDECDDGLEGPGELYFNVTVDGVLRSSKGGREVYSNLWPVDMSSEPVEFSHDVSLSKATVSLRIEMWDHDDNEWAHGDDDVCSIGPSADGVNLVLDLSSCKISGDVSGACGARLRSRDLEFVVNVVDPPRAPGLNVRCLHSPVWPQPGENVTIRAEALDGNADPITAGKVDDVAIWVDNQSGPYRSTARDGPAGVSATSVTYTPPAGATTIAYGCRAADDGKTVFTGWRVVQIGQPSRGRAVPVLYTGPRSSRIDIVFIPDLNYPGANDANFLSAVHDLIRDGYYAGDRKLRNPGRLFLRNQDALSFWIALDRGDHRPGLKLAQPPPNWAEDYNFADAGVIVYAGQQQRDFGEVGQRVFTAPVGDVATLLHETGHVPFGLADEYCCDGGYGAAWPYPNVYEFQKPCLADALAKNVADACQVISDPSRGQTFRPFYRLDSGSTLADDLMTGGGNYTPQPADERRINYLFDRCWSASCR